MLQAPQDPLTIQAIISPIFVISIYEDVIINIPLGISYVLDIMSLRENSEHQRQFSHSCMEGLGRAFETHARTNAI